MTSRQTETLLQEAEQLFSVASSSLQSDLSDLIQRNVEHLASNPSAGHRLSPALGKLKTKLNALQSAPEIHWVQVGSGMLAIGHRPRKKALSSFRSVGVTALLTLLSESEGANEIGDLCRRHGIAWHWLPFDSGDPPSAARNNEIAAAFQRSKEELDSSGSVFVHCSAGIHRTGMITLALFRFLKYSEQEADSILNDLRPHTADGVGSHRREWANGWGE